MPGDIFESGTPKYSTADGIYDALCEICKTEEKGILEEIGMDVSWDNEGYYYFDKGAALKDRFEEMSGYGEKMWLIDLAITQSEFYSERGTVDVHDLVYQALMNDDLAKLIGFKKMFAGNMLGGNTKKYAEISELYAEELQDLDHFGFNENWAAWARVMPEQTPQQSIDQYRNLTCAVTNKVLRLNLVQEQKLVAECQAHLTSYDDFIFGLRVNQALHEEQKREHGARLAALQTAYNEKVKLLLNAAEKVGLLSALTAEMGRLGLSDNKIFISLPNKNQSLEELND